MAKLWQKDYTVDALIERFTVGDDYLLDRRLVPADCVASLAHGSMLASIGILTAAEFESIKGGLLDIVRDHQAGLFIVRPADEDCHTAIENRLSERLGEAGKKIHTGRSRNDQVQAALRLHGRAALLRLDGAAGGLAEALREKAAEHAGLPMPGRTHMQLAMPSSVGLWLGAFAEEIADELDLLAAAYALFDQCPLGAAAGYGVPLPLDRELVSKLLGFGRLQNNMMYVNNSRGKFESVALDAAEQLCLTLGKLAGDLILFSLPEFGYFSLPAELCTGSSIMPQKKNPDGLELVRAKAGVVGACSMQVKNVIRSLPSGYNRDFQDTKEPFMRGLELARICCEVMQLSVERLEAHPDRLRAAFSPDLFATDRAYDLVARGLSFREAYRSVAAGLASLPAGDPDAALKRLRSSGSPGNLRLDLVLDRLAEAGRRRRRLGEKLEKACLSLTGFPVSLA